MIHLGVDKLYDEPHHQIVFANDYKQNLKDIFNNKIISDDISVYIRNASINDKTIAPEVHSSIYILVPVPNNQSDIDWDNNKEDFRKRIFEILKENTSFKDLKDHIIEERVVTPKDWEIDFNVFFGATFNLSHKLSQMLYFRPRNRFEEVDNCYLVGGGTHPGSGLPTIYESARISSRLIEKDLKD
jgi:phytoene desaturase